MKNGILVLAVIFQSALAFGSEAARSEAPLKMPTVKVRAEPQEFYVSAPLYDEHLVFLKSREDSPPHAPMTYFRIPGAKDGDRVLSIDGKLVSELTRRDRNKLMFASGAALALEVQAPTGGVRRKVTAIRVSGPPTK